MLIDDNIFAARSMPWESDMGAAVHFLLSFPFKATLSYFGFNVISSTQRTGEESDDRKCGSMVYAALQRCVCVCVLCVYVCMCGCVCLFIAESSHCDVHNSFITIPYLIHSIPCHIKTRIFFS